jgi:PHD/YefM family antitoxin component YafN of YafNO toxin-antitoxin module
MARTLPISAVKTHLPELLTGVEEREEEIVVTRKGRPAGCCDDVTQGFRAWGRVTSSGTAT